MVLPGEIALPPPGSFASVAPSPFARNPSGEPLVTPLRLAVFEFSLATGSLEDLDRLSKELDPRWLEERFERFAGTVEGALLATCHRRELVLLARAPDEFDRWQRTLPGPVDGWRRYEGREATRHVFRVAAGRESLAVGEREVRAQVRAAAHRTLSRYRRPIVRELFLAAADEADRLAPNVPSSRSIAAIAATRLLELTGPPFPRVLVVGAGVVGRQVTELLAPSARVTIAYHHRRPAAPFLRASGARVVRAGSLADEVAVSDAVVTATKSGDRCLGPEDLPRDRPIVLVDLGVPRNVDPAVRSMANVRLVDLEDLRRSAAPRPDPKEEVDLLRRADHHHARFEQLALEPWIDLLRRTVEEVRRDELERARRFLGPLTPAQELAIERLSRRLVQRLFRGPTERLRAMPSDEEADRLRRFALELLRPEPAGP